MLVLHNINFLTSGSKYLPQAKKTELIDKIIIMVLIMKIFIIPNLEGETKKKFPMIT